MGLGDCLSLARPVLIEIAIPRPTAFVLGRLSDLAEGFHACQLLLIPRE